MEFSTGDPHWPPSPLSLSLSLPLLLSHSLSLSASACARARQRNVAAAIALSRNVEGLKAWGDRLHLFCFLLYFPGRERERGGETKIAHLCSFTYICFRQPAANDFISERKWEDGPSYDSLIEVTCVSTRALVLVTSLSIERITKCTDTFSIPIQSSRIWGGGGVRKKKDREWESREKRK